MTDWPQLKTIPQLVLDGILPCSGETVRCLAIRHGVGRKLGRTWVFTPEDIQILLERLPGPSSASSAQDRPPASSAGLSAKSAYEKALALVEEGRRKKSRR